MKLGLRLTLMSELIKNPKVLDALLGGVERLKRDLSS